MKKLIIIFIIGMFLIPSVSAFKVICSNDNEGIILWKDGNFTRTEKEKIANHFGNVSLNCSDTSLISFEDCEKHFNSAINQLNHNIRLRNRKIIFYQIFSLSLLLALIFLIYHRK